MTSFLKEYGPIILSAIALFVAIYIPCHIARKQNQIAIFEKLYTSYSQLLLIQSFAEAIQQYYCNDDPNNISKMRAYFYVNFETSFGYHPDPDDFENSIGQAIAALRKNELQVYMLPMLISKSTKQTNKCDEMIPPIYEPLFQITIDMLSSKPIDIDDFKKNANLFVDKVNAFISSYGELIERMLLCGKNRV